MKRGLYSVSAFAELGKLPLQVIDVIDQDGDRLSEGVALHPSEVEHGCQQDLRGAQVVAALYVDPKGVYANLPNVEVWDEARDARLYAGPWPVVAHPPCAAWCKMAGLREVQHGLPRYQDHGTFAAALRAVRTWGGVLEHPAYSAAWARFGLQAPVGRYWSQSFTDPGWVCEVDQAAYGHRARKVTWLYYIGPPPSPLLVGDGVTVQTVENMDKRERSATPRAFRDALLALSRPQGLTG